MGFDKLVNFTGGLGKFISYIELVNEGTLRYQRFEIWADGLNSMLNNPFAILVGFGHGEVLLEYVTGIAFYESLFTGIYGRRCCWPFINWFPFLCCHIDHSDGP